MKPSDIKLGLEIQLLLLRHGAQVEDLATEMGITQESLSNLIHGRRRFKDETLAKLSATTMLKKSGLSLSRLKALRALDDYSFEELLLAVIEAAKQGAVERLPNDFLGKLRQDLERSALPATLADKKHVLLELMQQSSS